MLKYSYIVFFLKAMADWDVSSCWASSRVPSQHACLSRRSLPSDERDSAEELVQNSATLYKNRCVNSGINS